VNFSSILFGGGRRYVDLTTKTSVVSSLMTTFSLVSHFFSSPLSQVINRRKRFSLSEDSPLFPARPLIDGEEIVLISIILTLWGLTIALFFQRWGKHSIVSIHFLYKDIEIHYSLISSVSLF
jgi:hypothetical protein